MKRNTLVWVLVYGVVAYGAYQLFFSKKAYAKKIIGSGKYQSPLANLLSFDMAYLRVWSKAASKNEPTFTYKGLVYNTQGGKEIKK